MIKKTFRRHVSENLYLSITVDEGRILLRPICTNSEILKNAPRSPVLLLTLQKQYQNINNVRIYLPLFSFHNWIDFTRIRSQMNFPLSNYHPWRMELPVSAKWSGCNDVICCIIHAEEKRQADVTTNVHGNAFGITGSLWGKSTSHWWFPSHKNQ